MKHLSISELSTLTELARETVRKRLGDLTAKPGARNSLTYQSGPALRRILGATDDAGVMTESESRRLLNSAKREEIELNLEIKRKDWVPMDILNVLVQAVVDSTNGILKSSIGKVLSHQVYRDITGEITAALSATAVDQAVQALKGTKKRKS